MIRSVFSAIKTKKRRILYIGLPFVALVLVLYIAYRGYYYIEHDPKFCVNCHTMKEAYSLYMESSHNGLSCHECHVPTLSENLRQLYLYMTLRPDEVEKHAEVPNQICKKCHENEKKSSKYPQVAETPGHKQHTETIRVQCIHCHSKSLHSFHPPEEVCKDCHSKITLTANGMGTLHCLQCHKFNARDHESLIATRADCLECHRKKHVKEETFPEGKAPMKWECAKCHKPHEKMVLQTQDCVSCHKESVEKGALHKVGSHNECLSCHKPHTWKTGGRKTCESCHTDKTGHYAENNCGDCHTNSALYP